MSLEGAWRYNPKFGTTLSELHGAKQLIELRMDQHGNLMDTSVFHISSLGSQALRNDPQRLLNRSMTNLQSRCASLMLDF